MRTTIPALVLFLAATACSEGAGEPLPNATLGPAVDLSMEPLRSAERQDPYERAAMPFTLTLTNTGEVELDLSDSATTWSGEVPDGLDVAPPSQATLAPGASLQLDGNYNPEQSGEGTATLTLGVHAQALEVQADVRWESDPLEDIDGDGWSPTMGDCDDTEPAINPSNGMACVDEDGDGWSRQTGDCDDTDAGVHPDSGAAPMEVGITDFFKGFGVVNLETSRGELHLYQVNNRGLWQGVARDYDDYVFAARDSGSQVAWTRDADFVVETDFQQFVWSVAIDSAGQEYTLLDDGTVLFFDGDTTTSWSDDRITRTTAMALDEDADVLWLWDNAGSAPFAGNLVRLDLSTGTATLAAADMNSFGAPLVDADRALVYAPGHQANVLGVFDRDTGALLQLLDVGSRVNHLAQTPHGLWLSHGVDGRVTLLDPDEDFTQLLEVDVRGTANANAEGMYWDANHCWMWVATDNLSDAYQGQMKAIEPETGTVRKSITMESPLLFFEVGEP